MEKSSEITFDNLHEGDGATRDYRITPSSWEAFFSAFEDRNPLHTDPDYARRQGFETSVVHGAFLNGLLSHFIGMHFPGKNSILMSSEIRYLKPSYVNDDLTIEARIAHCNQSKRVLELQLTFTNRTRKVVAARAKVMVGMLNE